MSRLTLEELAEIRKRAEAATAGPWEYDKHTHCIDAPGLEVYPDLMWYDAEFIAHAREDVPKLIEEIQLLKDTLYLDQCEYLEMKRKKNEALAEVERLKVYELIFSKPVDLVAKDANGVAAKLYGVTINLPEGGSE